MRQILWAAENGQCSLTVASVEFPLERDDGREGAENATRFNLNKQRCCFAFFLSPLSPRASGGERCRLFALLLSVFWQNSLLGNLSGQVEEWSAALSVTLFPPLVFTFCLFAEWGTWTPLSFSHFSHHFSFFPTFIPQCPLSYTETLLRKYFRLACHFLFTCKHT